jgi:hypothetical protein
MNQSHEEGKEGNTGHAQRHIPNDADQFGRYLNVVVAWRGSLIE